MTTCKLITTLSILTLFFGCDNNKQGRQNEINRVVFATGGCFGRCSVQVIDIDSTLNVKYCEIKYADSLDFFIGKVNSDFWDTLNIKFENANYKQLDTSYQNSVDDFSPEIYIYYNDKVKLIDVQSGSLPDGVMTVYQWLITSIKQIQLERTKDSFSFPTMIVRPLPPIMMETIKFIPPTVEDK
ncbi:MAG: DUF6438 domain-containing protein [Bacteroidia bacterium]